MKRTEITKNEVCISTKNNKNHMNKILFFTTLLLSFWGSSQISVSVSGNIFNTSEDSVKISQFYGSHYIDFLSVPLSKKGDFTIKGKLPNPDYYVLRLGNTHINIIVKDLCDIKVYGDGSNIQSYANIIGSDESVNMNEFIKVLTAWNQKQASASQELKQSPEKSQEINTSMQREYSNFQSARQTFIAQNQNSPALLVALSTTNPENEFTVYESLVNQLVKSFTESPTIKEVNKNFIALKEKKEAANFLAEGKMAPDFLDTKLDGNTLKLSDLRGKVVLLDFWASWCGPCRKENPNVVKMYEKYNKDGFTVMSVSFDQDKGKWKNAIEADHLIWPNHVSDLKGWSSATGKIYQITSIPFTVLIDQEGKIIKTNLRGEALEQELLRIFGH